jgi:hypothetical protein
MILDLIAEFSSVISNYHIIKYRYFSASSELVIEIEFIDDSKLFVKDYLFADGKRKYSFHWQHAEGHCIYRWDNVPHHQNTGTFPFHRHVGKSEKVEDAEVMNLKKALHFISNYLS